MTILVSPQDPGYEIDEGELAIEMLAQASRIPAEQEAAGVDPEQFENIYQWFLA